MIDVHNHLLPGIDDGAADLDAALELARLAVADGITHLICTPHLQPPRFQNRLPEIQSAHQGFVQALAEAGIPLQVGMGAEVRVGVEILRDVSDGNIPFLGAWHGKNVMLLEFPDDDVPFGTEQLTQWLLARDIVPLIAHPERNRAVQRTPERLRSFIAQGCLLQVTAASLTGHFGPKAQGIGEQLIGEGMVTVLASDAHNAAYRPPMMSQGLAAATALIGAAAAQRLVTDNPWTLVQGQF